MVVLLLVLRFLSLLSDAALTVMAEVVVKVQAPRVFLQRRRGKATQFGTKESNPK